MISCTEFIPLYSELFKYLEDIGGHDEVVRYRSIYQIHTLQTFSEKKLQVKASAVAGSIGQKLSTRKPVISIWSWMKRKARSVLICVIVLQEEDLMNLNIWSRIMTIADIVITTVLLWKLLD